MSIAVHIYSQTPPPPCPRVRAGGERAPVEVLHSITAHIYCRPALLCVLHQLRIATSSHLPGTEEFLPLNSVNSNGAASEPGSLELTPSARAGTDVRAGVEGLQVKTVETWWCPSV